MENSWKIECFFDGECPLCVKEINMLRWMDVKKNIRFTDIADDNFEPEAIGKTMNELMAKIHGRLPSGQVIEGVDVFRHLYSAVGFKPVVALSRLPGVTQVLDVGYDWFARNRLKLTGRCEEGVCTNELHSQSAS